MALGPGGIDLNGIWQYGEDDTAGALFSDLLNIGQQATSDTIAALDGRVADLEEDTGWIYPTLAAGWSNTAGRPIAYRRIGGIVYFKGSASTSTTALGRPFTLPVGFRPLEIRFAPTGQTGSPFSFVGANGEVGFSADNVISGTSFYAAELSPYPAEQ